jgi:hypothetical protein
MKAQAHRITDMIDSVDSMMTFDDAAAWRGVLVSDEVNSM